MWNEIYTWNEISTRKYKEIYKMDFAFSDAFLKTEGLVGKSFECKCDPSIWYSWSKVTLWKSALGTVNKHQ